MTETTEPPPSGLLMGFILSLLTPFLMTGSIADPDLARRAVQETIDAYKTTAADQLVSTAQIVAYALTALDNLRLSLPPELSVSKKLKLRANANALTRSSHRATATLDAQRLEAIAPEPEPTEILAALHNEKIQPETTEPTTDRQIDAAWADAMTDVAKEFEAELAKLPPAQRRTHLARIGALTHIAGTLREGEAPPLKARLLASVLPPKIAASCGGRRGQAGH